MLLAPVMYKSYIPFWDSYTTMINSYKIFQPYYIPFTNYWDKGVIGIGQKSVTRLRKNKTMFSYGPVLAHYNPNLPICLATDTSAYCIDAMISHVFPDGTEWPVAFAWWTLTATERNYAQIQKEALSPIYAVQKFHQYLYGHSFVLFTDHKPLTTILGHKAGIPSLAAAHCCN